MKEQWKDVVGYEGLYKVSNLGRIKSLRGYNGHDYIKREKMLTPTKQHVRGNYERLIVRLTKNKKGRNPKVHRLVAEAFIPNPDGKPNINHIDGNTMNNTVDNLEWCTQKENIIHAYKIGLVKSFKIAKSELETLYIDQKKSAQEIAEICEASRTQIYNKLRKFNIKSRSIRESKIKYGITSRFLKAELKTKSQKQIALEIGCDPSLISHYKKKYRIGA